MILRFSNTLIGILNLATLLASIPIIGAGLWVARNSSSACQTFLETPLLAIGFVILIVSLLGFIGACFHISWALWLYLLCMLLLILTLIGFTIFGFAVTGTRNSVGTEVAGRNYREYELDKYSSWLRMKINDPQYWSDVQRCIIGARVCEEQAKWNALDYVQKDMSPVQSGCCKPPTSCSYGGASPDCFKWSNSPDILCYNCDSCKAGVLEGFRKDWQKISILIVVMLLLLISVYLIGCCAFRNVRRAENDYPHGDNRMSKILPRWDYRWWRWLNDRKQFIF